MANIASRSHLNLSNFVAQTQAIRLSVPHLLDSGVVRWKGAVRRSLRISCNQAHRNLHFEGRVLVDYNARKIVDARKLWGEIDFLNPLCLLPIPLERLILLLSLFAPRHLATSLRAVALALTMRRRLSPDTRIVVWNPYSVFHHAIVNVCGAEQILLMSPGYPLPKNGKNFLGFSAVRKCYSLSESEFTDLPVNFRYTSDREYVAFYLTSLSRSDPREERVKQFAEYLVDHGVDIVIRLHYSDSIQSSTNRLPSKLLKFVEEQDQERGVSSNQISISGISTVAMELLSADLNHFVCFGTDEDPGTFRAGYASPFWQWIKSQPIGLSRLDSNQHWVRQITKESFAGGMWLMDAVRTEGE